MITHRIAMRRTRKEQIESLEGALMWAGMGRGGYYRVKRLRAKLARLLAWHARIDAMVARVPYIEVDREGEQRLSFSIRVF